MKKRKKDSKRVYNNRLLYTLVVIGILAIVGVAVYADSPSAIIPNPGHSISEIQTCGTNGDTLEIVSGNWACVQAPAGPAGPTGATGPAGPAGPTSFSQSSQVYLCPLDNQRSAGAIGYCQSTCNAQLTTSSTCYTHWSWQTSCDQIFVFQCTPEGYLVT
ncbi:MAG: collagen-like protein [Candidatus Nanoarchaeia archaeon]